MTIARNIIVGVSGVPATVFPFGEFNSEERRDDIAVLFHYPDYNTEFDMNPAVIVGRATATVVDGYLELSSRAGERATAPSKNSIRYMGGHSGFAQFTASFAGEGTGTIGAWAADEDGFFIRVSNGEPQIGYQKGGIDTVVTPTGRYFYGGTIPVALIDWTKLNIFRIMFGYLGVANPVYEIKLNGQWFALGTIETEGRLDSTHISNPVLPITARADGAMEIRTASWNGGRVGGENFVGARFFCRDISKTLAAGAKATMGTFRNKATYQNVTNRVKALLVRYEFSVDAPAAGSGTVQFRIEKNANLAGNQTWIDNDTTNSVIDLDAVQTYASGGKTIFIEHVGYASGGGNNPKSGGSVSQQADSFGLFLLPNETATITAQNVGLDNTNVVTRAVFNWIELF
jgi:hypothetical protein